MNLTQSQLAKYMDHTLLKADATLDGIDRVVAEAKQFGCASVCVNPFWVPYVARLLDGSGVATCTVVGFPLGASSTASKVFETTDAIANGADEIDMVINIGELKAGHAELVREDIRAVAEATHAGGKLLKVIIECSPMTRSASPACCARRPAPTLSKPLPASPPAAPPSPTSPSCANAWARTLASRQPAASARSQTPTP